MLIYVFLIWESKNLRKTQACNQIKQMGGRHEKCQAIFQTNDGAEQPGELEGYILIMSRFFS